MPSNSLFSRDLPIVDIRAIHLDLKGVPPTPARLLSLLKIIAAGQYNAILVEWEDQFPWTVDERFRNETAYTPAEVEAFHTEAARLGIEILPLVQCLGHMETPLSLPDYARLREIPDRCDGLNPLASGARQLVEKMVDDVLRLTPSPRYFHLGGDEAWSFGTHPDGQAYVEKHGKAALYLQHVEPLLDRLIERGIRPILWHDMMLSWDEAALHRLAAKADLMVWGYDGRPDETAYHHAVKHFQRLKENGLTLWGAAAYKGADGGDCDLPKLEKRRANAQGFADISGRFNLKGLVATGWSRYATHQMQNEPIDAALDALMEVGVILHDGQPPTGGMEAILKELDRLGERERFIACKQAMQRLSAARDRAWRMVRIVRGQIVTWEMDPRRRGSRAWQHLQNLRSATEEARTAAGQSQSAFSELIAPLWIDRYLGERIKPLEEELSLLEARAKE